MDASEGPGTPPAVGGGGNFNAFHDSAFGVELPTAALRFPWREDVVRAVVLGAGTADELRETVRRARTPVPDALWEALAAQGLVAA